MSRPIAETIIHLLSWGMTIGQRATSHSLEAISDPLPRPCPQSPNCVSSISSGVKHVIAPLTYQCTPLLAYAALANILEADPQARMVIERPEYLRVEFTSIVFGFIDDVDFYFSTDAPRIHVRSASRFGYYDFGANRRRLERLRRQFRYRTASHTLAS